MTSIKGYTFVWFSLHHLVTLPGLQDLREFQLPQNNYAKHEVHSIQGQVKSTQDSLSLHHILELN